MIQPAEMSPTLWLTSMALLGLCMGSFLNVVIGRLPIMMEQAWARELAQAQGEEDIQQTRFDLLWPPSHCPSCKTRLRWHDNIPVLSFLWLKAQCGHCGVSISWRYPAVELLTAGGFAAIALLYPQQWSSLALMGFLATLIALAAIDLDTFLLPDQITLPLVWAGLAAQMIWHWVPLHEAVIGAMAGYLVLWLIYHLFRLATGKEGMGYGDFKLLAAIGAWLGVKSLFTVVLLASVSGVLFGLALLTLRGQSKRDAFPFGPCLVLGALAWMAQVDVLQWLMV